MHCRLTFIFLLLFFPCLNFIYFLLQLSDCRSPAISKSHETEVKKQAPGRILNYILRLEKILYYWFSICRLTLCLSTPSTSDFSNGFIILIFIIIIIISLSLSLSLSLYLSIYLSMFWSFIASGSSCRQHPLSVQSYNQLTPGCPLIFYVVIIKKIIVTKEFYAMTT